MSETTDKGFLAEHVKVISVPIPPPLDEAGKARLRAIRAERARKREDGRT